MRWLLCGKLTPAAADALRRHEHHAQFALEAGLTADAPPDEVLRAAAKLQMDVMTDDPAIASAPFGGEITFARTIVYLLVGPGDVEQDDAVDRLFKRYARLSPGRLYTVTNSRVKVRQLPGSARSGKTNRKAAGAEWIVEESE